MIAYVLVVWLCSPQAAACDARHALQTIRSAPMNQFVCVTSLPRYARATRRVQSAAGCERVDPEV